MMPKAPIRILAVAAICIAALIGLVLREGAARAAGTEIMLAMEAYDPRALLQGHYVMIDLRDRLPPGQPCPPVPDTADQIWVAFAPDGDTHRVAGAAAARADAEHFAPLVARGFVTCTQPTAIEGEPQQPAIVWLNLGFDRFYIDQADATRIERVLRGQSPDAPGRVFAIVSIGQDGRGRLKGLVVDGERLELGWD